MDNLIKLIGKIPVQLELFERVVWEYTVGQELPFPQIREQDNTALRGSCNNGIWG